MGQALARTFSTYASFGTPTPSFTLEDENPWSRASSNANPPPMQKAVTPVLPVQPSGPASPTRTASTSSNALPAGHASRGQWRGDISSAAPLEEVGCHGQIALARQPVDLVAQVLAHAPGVVDDHNPRPRSLIRSRRQIRGHLSASTRDFRLGHHVSSTLGTRRSEHMPKGALLAVSGSRYPQFGSTGVRCRAHASELARRKPSQGILGAIGRS